MKSLILAVTFFTIAAQGNPAAETYLAVGPGGQRMFAKDGVTWENHVAWGEPKHDQNDLNAAAFFKGAAYVGGGFSVARMTATRDGKTWSEGVLPKGSPVFGLEVLNDTLYAVTLHGQVYKTADGETWTLIGTADMPPKTHCIRKTASGNGIIVGSGDFGPALAFDPKTEKITVTQMAGQTEKNGTMKRVAFGNGVFVVSGQDGLLAMTKDGLTWQNNETHPERGSINSVAWTGVSFLASTERKGSWVSKDGIVWSKLETEAPRMMVRANEWLYGWAWPPNKIQRSRDGAKWEPVTNASEYHVKHVAFGNLTGTGTPPKLPEGRVPPAGINPKQ